MPEMTKVVRLAHLLSNEQAIGVTQDIILDALFDISKSVDYKRLKVRIIELFGVEIPDNLVRTELSDLQKQGAVANTTSGEVYLSDLTKAELSRQKVNDSSVFDAALKAWTSNKDIFDIITVEESSALKATAILFLNRVFVTHGASCVRLLIQEADATEFDINGIATDIAEWHGNEKDFLKEKLPTIFSMAKSMDVVRLLEHIFTKAIKYLSSVMPVDIRDSLSSKLSGVVIYLDTNFLYRLLDLQGEERFLSAKETLDFCKSTGVSLRITAETYQELTNRIYYDARILNDHPIKTNLAQFGYKFRTEDNYISSYWRKARISRLSTTDYNESFADPSIILKEQYEIVIEEVADKSADFKEMVNGFYDKICKFSKGDEKTTSALWHDAYCLATVRKAQKPSASNAVDSRCLFLTTDRQLINLQATDDELKRGIPLALTPSQLLQLFSFTTSVGNYVDTFVTLFSSAAIHRNGQRYNNEHIQEILSRISHYDFYKPEVAESILEAQLFRGGYNPEASDAEKEETIYKAISEELLSNLKQERDENIKLWESKSELETTLAQKNEDAYRVESERKRNAETIKNQSEEISQLINNEAVRRYAKWRVGHIICIILAGLLFIVGGILVVNIVRLFQQPNVQGAVQAAQFVGTVIFVGMGIPLFRFGFKVASPNHRAEITEKYRGEIQDELARSK
jgi:hypothetical protein